MPGGAEQPCCVASWDPGGRRPSARLGGRRHCQGSHLHTVVGGRLRKVPEISILEKDCSTVVVRALLYHNSYIEAT